MRGEHIAEFIAAYYDQEELTRKATRDAVLHKKQRLAQVEKKLSNLIDAVANGLKSDTLQQQFDNLESERAQLVKDINSEPPEPPILHPNLSKLYRRQIDRLHEALNQDAVRTEAAEILRSLIEQVRLVPSDDGYEIELIGEIANMVELALERAEHSKKAVPGRTALSAEFYRSVKVVAGARFELTTFRL